MNRQKISREFFAFVRGVLISHEVENEPLCPMGATYKTKYSCGEDFIVYEIGGVGGSDFYMEALK